MNTSEPNSLKWREEFDELFVGKSTGQLFSALNTPRLVKAFISRILSQQKEEAYVEILAAAESMETAREVRHFIKDKILSLK